MRLGDSVVAVAAVVAGAGAGAAARCLLRPQRLRPPSSACHDAHRCTLPTDTSHAMRQCVGGPYRAAERRYDTAGGGSSSRSGVR